jgi:hypothetical protein
VIISCFVVFLFFTLLSFLEEREAELKKGAVFYESAGRLKGGDNIKSAYLSTIVAGKKPTS